MRGKQILGTVVALTAFIVTFVVVRYLVSSLF